jgi:hypothetical protein
VLQSGAFDRCIYRIAMGCALLVSETMRSWRRVSQRRYPRHHTERSYCADQPKDMLSDGDYLSPLRRCPTPTIPFNGSVVNQVSNREREECAIFDFTNHLCRFAHICSAEDRRLLGCICTTSRNSVGGPNSHQWRPTHTGAIRSEDAIH